MSQPCIKFISFIASYVVLVGLVIMSSLQLADEELNMKRFANLYPVFVNNFTHYVNNEKLLYRFEVEDFFIRNEMPTSVDFVISIWIFG